jgi:hypothetical protein
MNRSLTAKEASIVQWLVDHAGPNDPVGPWRIPVEELRVVGGCSCGCCSIYFHLDSVKVLPIRQAIGTLADGRQNGLILWGTDDEIRGLEVYDLYPDASHELPEVDTLQV